MKINELNNKHILADRRQSTPQGSPDGRLFRKEILSQDNHLLLIR